MSHDVASRPTLVEWLLIVLLSGLSIVLIMASEQMVTVHYTFAGEPGRTGNRFELLLIPLSGLLLFILMKWIKRFSSIFNYPVKITPENIQIQKELAIKLLDSYALITLIVFNLFLLHLIYITVTDKSRYIWLWGIVFLISYLAPIPVYLRKAFDYQNKL